MGNGELNGLDTREIGRVHDMLPARARFGLLAQHVRHGITHRIERSNRRQAQKPASRFQCASCIAIHQSEQHKSGIGGHIGQYSVQMAFRTHHGPKMLDHIFCAVKLRQCSFGDVFQGFAGGIR